MNYFLKAIKLYTVILIFISCKAEKNESEIKIINDQSYFSSVEKFRMSTNSFFESQDSPLEDSMKTNFIGLQYFSIDTVFRIPALYETIKDGEIFKIAVSGSSGDNYQTVGKLHFNLSGKHLTLEIYENQTLKASENPYFFIPFSDNTNGKETYGGGRYLDFTPPATENMILDFNMAYQPYCAYNHAYSCPIPTTANKLNIEIRAGERL